MALRICFTRGSCWSSRTWANFYPCGQFQRHKLNQLGGGGGGRALNGIDLFCPWQKIKDNIENINAEKLHHKFIYTFQEPGGTLDTAISDP